MTAIILDTETHKLHGEVIQMAYMMFDEDNLTVKYGNENSYTMDYQPSETIDYEAMAIHHIIDSDLVLRRPSSEVFIPKNVKYVIGHNIDYDIDAIKRSIQRCTDEIDEIKRIDTLAIIRFIHPDWNSHKLTVICYRLAAENKIKTSLYEIRGFIKKAHNALVDCVLTNILTEYIVASMQLQSIEDLYQVSERARIPTHIFYGKYKGQKITDLSTTNIMWLLSKTDDIYLINALENELEDRGLIFEIQVPSSKDSSMPF
ncbi:MAG TPA: DNA polymerase III subunit epsilon [Acinetobacter ursingii]|uniref:DNA polymerase III subunit epsilon n=1 Tax=Acinetobacter ursingii TaxID=108980 RepID=A0A3D2SJZ8_9GAMM|nr:DNA polymerase III subunit epsilon [Acinetobacter ursingii]